MVIDFWATWCDPCALQPPELNAVLRAHAKDRLTVLGVETSGASADEVREWGRENEAIADYPVLVGADEDLARRYGVGGFPATVVIDPEGRIDSVVLGVSTAAEIEQAIAICCGAKERPPSDESPVGGSPWPRLEELTEAKVQRYYQRTLSPGEVVYDAGDPSEQLYVIQSGEVELIRETPRPSSAWWRGWDRATSSASSAWWRGAAHVARRGRQHDAPDRARPRDARRRCAWTSP